MKYNTIEHQFRPGDTVSAVIKYYNGYTMTLEESEFIMKTYFEINPKKVPTVGSTNKIPVIEY